MEAELVLHYNNFNISHSVFKATYQHPHVHQQTLRGVMKRKDRSSSTQGQTDKTRTDKYLTSGTRPMRPLGHGPPALLPQVPNTDSFWSIIYTWSDLSVANVLYHTFAGIRIINTYYISAPNWDNCSLRLFVPNIITSFLQLFPHE